ncbi:MAG: hypothetical protein AB2L14_14605 [Candidatus Xenobiia bacterium LiM19]
MSETPDRSSSRPSFPSALIQETLAALLKAPQGLVKQALMRIPLMLLSFAGGFIAHTYMVAWLNEGFTGTSIYSPFLNINSNMPGAVAFWGIISAFFWSTLFSLFKPGPAKTFKTLASSPGEFLTLLRESGRSGQGALLFSVGTTLFLTKVLNILPQAQGLAGILLTVMGLTSPGYLLSSSLFTIWMKAQEKAGKGVNLPFDARISKMIIMGIGLSFLLGAFLPPEGHIAGAIAIIIAGLILWTPQKNIPAPGAPAGMLFFITLGTAAFYLLCEALIKEYAFADDGGRGEANGDFITWLGSQGASTAIATGIIPGAAGSLGPLAPPLVDSGADDPEKLEKIRKMQEEIDYHRKEADAWRSKLNEATDPKVREELKRRILEHDDAASRFNDEITAIKGDGIVHHTKTEMDNLNKELSKKQSKEMEDDLKAKSEVREQDWKNKDTLDSLIKDLNEIQDEKQREHLKEMVNTAAQLDGKGIPGGDVSKLSKFVKAQIDADKAPRRLGSEIAEIGVESDRNIARETLATITFGVSENIAEAWIGDKGPLGITKGAVEGVANVVTLGGYSGYENGGVTGAVKAIANTVLPIEEAGVIKDFVKGCVTGEGEVTWDQAAGAFGWGTVKVLTLGHVKGELTGKPAPVVPGLGEPPGGGPRVRTRTFGEIREQAYNEARGDRMQQQDGPVRYRPEMEAERPIRNEAQEVRETAEREARERAEQEAREKAEQEAREKAEQEAREKAEQEAREKAEQEARERAEQEAREKAEQEAREKAEQEAREKAEQEAREKAEQEAREKAEQEAREKAEQEAREKAEQEAREKAEQEARERAEQEAREKAEQEAHEKAEQEAREKAEQEAREKAEQEAESPKPSPPPKKKTMDEMMQEAMENKEELSESEKGSFQVEETGAKGETETSGQGGPADTVPSSVSLETVKVIKETPPGRNLTFVYNHLTKEIAVRNDIHAGCAIDAGCETTGGCAGFVSREPDGSLVIRTSPSELNRYPNEIHNAAAKLRSLGFGVKVR